jgi:UDP-glucuronate decarboxylase
MSSHRQTRRVLVCGGAGFLGSHLIDRLISRGDKVLCIDNLFSGRKQNIARWLNNPSFEFLLHDICDPVDIKVDQIYNLACPASPTHYQIDPVQTLKTCVMGALNLLNLAHQTKAKILQASTSEIYGDPLVHPQIESYWGHVNPIGVRSCYDEGKRCAETLFFDFHRKYQVDIRVIRIFNTYGPRMHSNDGRVVSNFIVQALKGEPLTLFGDGSQTRSFCFVDDLIDGMIAAMDEPVAINPHTKEQMPINLGNPNEQTVLSLAEQIISLTGSSSQISFNPLPSDDPRQRQPDISLAMQHLKWIPQVDLKQGLQKTIKYFEESDAC